MKNLFLLTVVILGGIVAWYRTPAIVKPAEAQAAPAQAIMAEMPTLAPTATLVPTVTPDPLLLEKARAEAAAAQAEEQAAQVRLQMAQRDATETAVYYEGIHAQETQAAAARETATQAAIGKATQVTYSLMVQATQAGAATATAYAPIAERDRRVAEIVPDLLTWLAVLAGLCIAAIAFFIIRYYYSKTKTDRIFRETLGVEPKPAPAVAPVSNFAGDGDRLVNRSIYRRCGVSDEKMLEIARRVLSGEPFIHQNFTPAERGISETKFTRLQEEFVKFDLARWIDPEHHQVGLDWTPFGTRFLERIAGLNTPPPAKDGPDMARNAGKDTIDDGFTPL